MPAFYIIEEAAGRVAFIRRVEAETAEDAKRIDAEEGATSVGHTIIHAEDVLSVRAVPVGSDDPATDPAAIYLDPPPVTHHTGPKIRKVCDECGSDDVRCDAFAAWDVEAQEWVLGSTYDAEHCEHCQGEARLVDEAIDPDAPELPEIEPPEPHAYKSVGDLEGLIPDNVNVTTREYEPGWNWQDLTGDHGKAGPFRNKRSALADYLTKHPTP